MPRIAAFITHPIQYIAPLFRALAKADDVDVLVIYGSRKGLDPFFDVQMQTTLAWHSTIAEGYAHIFLSSDERSIDTILRSFRPDATIVNGYNSWFAIKAVLGGLRRRIPVFLLADSSTDSTQSLVVRRIKRLLMPLLYRLFAGIIIMSDASKEFFGRYGVSSDKLCRIPLLLDESFWLARSELTERRREIRASYAIPENAFVLLYVGKVYDTKRVDDLFNAAARTSIPNLHVLVVGDGKDLQAIKSLSRELGVSATFTGFVNLDRLAHFYCAADVLVHPAEIEQYGVVLVEASIIGLPLIVSDKVGALGETSIAQDGRNAIKFTCRDVEALSTAIRRVANDAKLRNDMANASASISLSHRGTEAVLALKRAVANA